MADGEWHRVAHNLAAESVELADLRCALGCVFKARVRAVEGFDGYSRNSAPLPTKTLPRPRAGALRLELRLGSAAPPSERPEERPEGSPSAEGGSAPSDAALPPPPPRRAPPPPTRASTRARGRHGTPRPPPPPASRPRSHRVAAPLKLGAWNKTTRTEPMPFKHNYTVPGSDVAS